MTLDTLARKHLQTHPHCIICGGAAAGVAGCVPGPQHASAIGWGRAVLYTLCERCASNSQTVAQIAERLIREARAI